jgi:hypothetical protein
VKTLLSASRLRPRVLPHLRFGQRALLWPLFCTLCLPAMQRAQAPAAVCDRDPTSALVFVGTLTSVSPASQGPGWSKATFTVTESLVGQPTEEVTMLISKDTVLMSKELCVGSAGVPPVGEIYLVQTHVLSNGYVEQLEHCQQMLPIEQASAQLSYFRDSRLGRTPTGVSGEARVYLSGLPWRIPLPGASIDLGAKKEERFHFVSEADGRFDGTLKAGQYEISTEFPVGYETDYCSPSSVNVVEHRCTLVSVCAHPTASITAHIVDRDGKQLGPMTDIQLSLVTADNNDFVKSVWPDEKSELVVDQLLPGRYLLGLNTYLPWSRGQDPYPPTYFPGVSERSQAEVITIAPGEHKVLGDMRIEEGKECKIHVLVVGQTGRPSPSTEVALAYRDFPHSYTKPREATDAAGKETVYAVFPAHVFLRAVKRHEDGSVSRSQPVELGSCPAKPALLKLSSTVGDAPLN